MGWLRRVLSDTTMGTVGSTTSWWGTVALSVCDNKEGSIEPLGFGVRNSVRQQVLVDLHGLDRPTSGITRRLVLLGLCVVSNTTRVSNKRNSGLEGKDFVAKLESLLRVHASSVVGNFAAMLEMDAKVGASRFGGLFRDIGFN